MLSAIEIADRLTLPDDRENKLTIVPQPDVEALKQRGGTSVDLRLGRWFRSFKQTQTTTATLIGAPVPESDRSHVDASRTSQHFVPFGKEFVLHPGRFVLGVTLEWLRLPTTLSGYVTGKSSLGRHGLVIETAAGIHPGFSGCLTLELANVGEVPLSIFPGMEICQIFLHEVLPTGLHNVGAMSGKRKPSLPLPRVDPIFEKICQPF